MLIDHLRFWSYVLAEFVPSTRPSLTFTIFAPVFGERFDDLIRPALGDERADVHRARLMGRVEPKTGIAPFTALVNQVMSSEPYASARRVFWIVDNGSSHAGRRSIARMRKAWPTAQLVHLPIHASWLNQIEIVFSVIQRKVIKPADFADLDALSLRLTAFEPRYNATATPFDWRFTRADLTAMLSRIDAHIPAEVSEAEVSCAAPAA